jgi:single-strand DNA-binding protein
MASFNKVILMGNLTRDPELRYTPGGSPVCSLGLAVNRRYRQNDEWKEEVCFVDITVWGRQAENCSEYLSKGSGIMLEGRLQQHSWDAEDGKRRSKLEVVANNIQFLPRMGGKAEEASPSEPKMEANGIDDGIPLSCQP